MGYKDPEQAKLYRILNADKAKARSKKWREDNPERSTFHKRNGFLKREYGITLETYERMLKEQKGICAICKEPPKTRSLDVDHTVISTEVSECFVIRGLLCNNCNRALGHFKDNVEILKEAIKYLEKY